MVREVLDLRDLLRSDRRVVAEVEAQAVGRDERTRLLHVLAEHLAQRPVQQVRAGVVPADRVAPLDVDGRDRVLPGSIAPSTIARDVAAKAGQRVGGVEHLGEAGVGADRAGVADLATGLRVERRAVEEDLDDAVVVGGQHREHAALRLALDVAGEVGLPNCSTQLAVRVGVRRAGCPALRASLPRRRCSAIAASKPAVSTSMPRSAAISFVSSSGKPNVSCRRNATSPAEHLRLAQVRDLLVEDREAVAHRLAEALLLAGDDARDEVAVALEVGVRVAHHLDRLIDQRRHHELLAAEQVGVAHRRGG